MSLPSFVRFTAARSWRCRFCATVIYRDERAWRCSHAGAWALVGDVLCWPCGDRAAKQPAVKETPA